jgi:O-antigen ligase
VYAPVPEDVHVAHNSFFQILGDAGVPGAAVWLFLVIALWRTASRVERSVRLSERGGWTDARYYVIAVKASWIGYVVCGAFLSQEDFDFFYQLLAITSRLVVLTAVPVVAASERASVRAIGPVVGVHR